MIKKPLLNIQKKHTNRFLLFIYALLTCVILYHLYYADKIINGVVVANIDLSGLTIEEAYNKIENEQNNLPNKLTYTYQDSVHSIELQNISFSYDSIKTVNYAFSIGRSDNILIDSKDKFLGFLKSKKINPIYTYDSKSLENEILRIKGNFNKPYTNAQFILSNNNELQISNSLNGYKIIEEDFYNSIVNSFDNYNFDQKNLSVQIIQPVIIENDLENIKTTVQNLIQKDFSVYYDSSSWNLDEKQKLDLIAFDKDENQTISLNLNKPTFNSFIDLIKYDIEVLPKGKVQEDSQGMVVAFELIQPGTQIDEDTFYNNFRDAFFNENTNEVTISTKIVDNFDIEKYGIYQLLGTGTSKYTGSGSTRVHNLTLAAQRASGVLVPPNGIYSLNKAVGAINGSTGYQVGYIISGGRTVLGEGGGVCQTSTTLFRAVLNSGLPIVMRYAHDYRVGYYEIESPVGFDAAIFQPSLDFRFKNDTPNYILVQSSYDLDESSLTFKIYGTSDGRTVEITEPIVTSQTPAPAPLYQDDPTLPKGVVRQVDWAAPGANVSFSRTVKLNGENIIEDTFVSRYYPWRAVYLVGTKE